MTQVNFPRKALACAIALGCSGISAFSAGEDEAPLLEEVEVVGLKRNLLDAQELKRQANTVKDVITASDIGALPDKSVTEALMRVPGVTIERFAASDDPNHFAAEGTGVVVRGLKRTRSEINGRESFSARRDGSGLNFEDIPPELLGRAEVIKNTTADLIAGGPAGTVNLVTRKPFDSDELELFGSVKGSYGDHIEEWSPAYSGLFSNVWDTSAGKFGVLISGAYSEYQDRGDGVALDNYYERSATAMETDYFGHFGTELSNYAGQTLYVPSGPALRSSDSERERTGITTAVQWASPDDRFEVTLEYIQSNASLSWDERVVQYGEQGFKVNPNNIQVADGASFNDQGFMNAGTLTPNWMLAQSRSRASETDIADTSLHFTFRPTDQLTIDFDVQNVESDFAATDYTLTTRFDNLHQDYSVTDVYFDARSSIPSVNFRGQNLGAPTSENELFLNSAMDKEDDYNAGMTALALDVEYEFNDSIITSIKSGLYHSEKETTVRDSDWNWGEFSCAWANYEGGVCRQANAIDHPELFENYTYSASDFHGGGVVPNDQTLLFARMNNVRDWQNFHSSTSVNNGGISTFVPLRERDCLMENGAECELQGAYLPSEISSTEEERTEFYIMANYAFDDLAMPIKGNLGLRYVNWQVSSTGATQFPVPLPGWWDPWAPDLLNSYTPDERAYQNALNTDAVTVDGTDHDKVLPSFNISMAVTDEQIVRFAASQNVFFPTFTDVRNFKTVRESHVENFNPDTGVLTYTDISFDGDTGNPFIEPEESINLDITYEWYFDAVGSVAASLFYKEFDGIIRERLYVEEVYNSEADVTMPVNFTQQTNQGDGNIQGIELSYSQFYDALPGGWSGLGFSFNYTYLDQSGMNDEVGFGDGVRGDEGQNSFRSFNNLDLPGYSDDTVNVALMYEKYGLSARLAYNWRSEYLLTRRDSDMFAPVIADSTGQLDASIRYAINDNFTVGIEATNLTDEIISTQLQYDQEGTLTPRNYFKTDRRYALTLQARY